MIQCNPIIISIIIGSADNDEINGFFMHQTPPPRKFVVLGATGSGKSTFAKELARKINIPCIELDALHWLPGWKHVPEDEFRQRVEIATSGKAWVVDGNYGEVRDITWPRAETIIWLDYRLWTVFWRLWRRTWSRSWNRELLWGTNYETLYSQLKIWSAEDSLFHWLFKTYWRRKRQYPELFKLPEFSHLNIIQFQRPEEAEEWLQIQS